MGVRTLQILALAGALSTVSADADVLRVLQPATDATVHSNSGNVDVVVTGALPGTVLRPLLDGRPAGGSHNSPTFELHGVQRGAHTLVIVAVDGRGHEVGRTAPVQFHVWHASSLMRHAP
jgi:hypothetical protein